jgi:hypothetical protein
MKIRHHYINLFTTSFKYGLQNIFRWHYDLSGEVHNENSQDGVNIYLKNIS